MVDFYALPQEGACAWPGRSEAAKARFALKAAFVEDALHSDLTAAMGRKFDPGRFVPFVVMHEFEGLLFSDCRAFSHGIGKPDLEKKLQSIRDEFTSPEEINDSPDTAPSKRVRALIPQYEKPLYGTLAILEIGLARIRLECPHFNSWLERLEGLVR
jgi:hypothetical protein